MLNVVLHRPSKPALAGFVALALMTGGALPALSQTPEEKGYELSLIHI